MFFVWMFLELFFDQVDDFVDEGRVDIWCWCVGEGQFGFFCGFCGFGVEILQYFYVVVYEVDGNYDDSFVVLCRQFVDDVVYIWFQLWL